MKNLENTKVAVLVCDGFEEVELTEPCSALKEQGATVDIISPNKEKVKAWAHTKWSQEYPVDIWLEEADPYQYDALLLPGGVLNPDKLRVSQDAINFITHFFEHHKPIAAICHGPWTLIETKKVKHRRMTSYHSIKSDLENAGANWVDAEVVVDDNLVTSRHPGDLPAFIAKISELFAKSK